MVSAARSSRNVSAFHARVPTTSKDSSLCSAGAAVFGTAVVGAGVPPVPAGAAVVGAGVPPVPVGAAVVGAAVVGAAVDGVPVVGVMLTEIAACSLKTGTPYAVAARRA